MIQSNQKELKRLGLLVGEPKKKPKKSLFGKNAIFLGYDAGFRTATGQYNVALGNKPLPKTDYFKETKS